MTLIGTPSEWVNFIDSLVPDILELVISTWEDMPTPAADAHENPITKDLCRRIIQNKKSSELPFRVHYQSVELEPVDGTDQGDMDIAFFPRKYHEKIFISVSGAISFLYRSCRAQKPRVAGRLFGFGSLFISHVSIPTAFVSSAVPSRSGRVPLPGSLLFRTEMSCRLHVLMEHAHNHQIPFCLAIIDDVLSHGVEA